NAQKVEGLEPWFPFQSEDEWELAPWLMESGASQGKIDWFLKLNKIQNDVKPSFQTKCAFLQYIDSLPQGPEFTCTPMKVIGDLKDADSNFWTETLELWHQDPLDCVAEILGNPLFENHQTYCPQHVFQQQQQDGSPFNQEYNEMWTADWWWETQVNFQDMMWRLLKLTRDIGQASRPCDNCTSYPSIR
ncbi:hypothetical protein BDP27DRAFT_1230135, partial [Rhodocollybia butyracea]